MPTDSLSPWNRNAWRQHLPPDVDIDHLNLRASGTLLHAWRQRWAEAPHEVALVPLSGSEKSLTREDVHHETAAAAARFHALGLHPGNIILMSARPSTSLILLHIAALRLGAIVVPVNPAYRQRELDHIVRDCQPSLAVIDDAKRAAWIQRSSARGPALPIVDPRDPPPASPPPALPDTQLDNARPENLALIIYTSGTTGAPKGAGLTHANLLAASRSLELAWRWTAGDGLVLALPIFHIHGLGVGVHTSLLTGARILLLPRFDPLTVLEACSRPDATLFFGVPTMWVRLADTVAAHPELAPALRSLRLLVSGSAPLAPTVLQAIEAHTGQIILERYGMSETVMLISNPYDGPRRPGTVGLPLPGVQVRVSTAGAEAAADQVGEIQVKGPNIFPGYWNRPDATREAFTNDGWFRTGDLGWKSADGYVTIVGRRKELIITGGYNVYPREVEEVLEAHPSIAEAAVVGLPSREWGEEVAAFLVPATPEHSPTNDDLTAWCRDRLANYKIPRRFTLVDQLPRNAMGKLLRANLRNR
jgi:malonyl-CoA/methylmalonyl-CoA synthetase